MKNKALEKEMKEFIICELKQNAVPLSIGDLDCAVTFETFTNGVSELYYSPLCRLGGRLEEALSECAEELVIEGMLKRKGRNNRLNQEYCLSPKALRSSKETAMEKRIERLEQIIKSITGEDI